MGPSGASSSSDMEVHLSAADASASKDTTTQTPKHAPPAGVLTSASDVPMSSAQASVASNAAPTYAQEERIRKDLLQRGPLHAFMLILAFFAFMRDHPSRAIHQRTIHHGSKCSIGIHPPYPTKIHPRSTHPSIMAGPKTGPRNRACRAEPRWETNILATWPETDPRSRRCRRRMMVIPLRGVRVMLETASRANSHWAGGLPSASTSWATLIKRPAQGNTETA